MPRATLSIPAAAEHVRTARLVAVAAARRAGLDEEAVDDVRLAVGETAARAVVRSGEATTDVELVLRDEGDRFVVEVLDGSDPARHDRPAAARPLEAAADQRSEPGCLDRGLEPRESPGCV